MRAIKGLSRLTELGFVKTDVTNDSLANIAALHHLHTLDISGTQVVDAGEPYRRNQLDLSHHK